MAVGMSQGQQTGGDTDRPPASPSGERWVSLRELAELRGISQHSAARLVRRHRWRRQTDNRGHVLALVPIEALDRPADTPSAGTGPAPGLSSAAVETVLAALREAHAAELARVTERVTRADAQIEHLRETLAAVQADRAASEARAEGRIDALIVGHREQIVAIEAKLTAETARADDLQGRLVEAEQVKEAARKRAHELANRMMRLEAEAEEGRETKERLTGLDRLLADAEHRLAEAEQGRRTAQERLDAQDRADVARRGKGRWARLRAAWWGE
jgi:hypothetical protein